MRDTSHHQAVSATKCQYRRGRGLVPQMIQWSRWISDLSAQLQPTIPTASPPHTGRLHRVLSGTSQPFWHPISNLIRCCPAVLGNKTWVMLFLLRKREAWTWALQLKAKLRTLICDTRIRHIKFWWIRLCALVHYWWVLVWLGGFWCFIYQPVVAGVE